MEPGFAFLSSSRGCAPFTVRIETLYLSSTPGTQYFVSWGDGTAEEVYTQSNATGVIIQHTYPNSPVTCGYDLTIDAANACNPRGSVIPVSTQVVVWTNDIVSMDPAVFRVCQGYAASVQFTDNSDWNCFPRSTRENAEPRWIQWIYGTGSAANRIPSVRVNGVTPPTYPYLDPTPGKNPVYPVPAPGEVSLVVQVPATTPADIGKEFFVTLNNWNQCNPYDNVLTDGNPFNPVNGDLVNGDNSPQTTTGRIVIVPSPEPQYVTRLANATGPLQNVFCVGDDIYFDNITPSIGGASLRYTWEFFDNATGAGIPAGTSTQSDPVFSYSMSGEKLVRLRVRDANAAGDCEAVVESTIIISPSLAAQIQVTDLSDNPVTPDFCQEPEAPFTSFSVRFRDVSAGTASSSTQWRWEFYDENNTLVFEAPAAGAFSPVALGPFDRVFTNKGIYRVRLIIRDNITACQTEDEVQVRVFEKPEPAFTFTRACEGNEISFSDQSTLRPIAGEQIVSWEWDMSYDGTFNKDPALDNQRSFLYNLGAPGSHPVAMQVTASEGNCSSLIAQPVIVDPLPAASFTADVTSGCSTLPVTFTNSGAVTQLVTIDRYIWEIDAGNGTGFQVDSVQRPTDPNFSIYFIRNFINNTTTNQDYIVRLRVVTVNDCERVSAPVTITVFPAPRAGFNSTNYSPFEDNCSPQTVNFTIDQFTQSLQPVDYTWTIQDAAGILQETSTGTVPSFDYDFVNTSPSIKDFRITLRATLPGGCSGDSTRIIRINPVPSSLFTSDTLESDCYHTLIRFEADQKGLREYRWKVEINGVVMLANSTTDAFLEYDFERVSSGNLNAVVSLTTTNFANCVSNTAIQNVPIPPLDNINASFTASPLTTTLPESTVSITNTTSPGPWTYHWDFGDGAESADPGVGQHTYQTFGTYTIKLTVMHSSCVDEHAVTVEVRPIPPVLDFDYHPASGCPPLKVTFTNRSKYADPQSYFWKFGENEGTSRAVNPTYTYYESGTYSVTLYATNVTGDTVQVTKHAIIEVHERPRAQFTLKPQIVHIPGGKLYTDNQSFGASSFHWDFGDGSTSDDYEPAHEYAADGVFDVTLVAANSFDCRDTSTVKAAVRVTRGGQLLIPNAFSPSLSGPGNNLGTNDVFLPLMRGVEEFQLLIFNRWGELIFETKDPQSGWDGYFKGKLCPQDVYVYKITARYHNGDMVTRVGDVHLIR